MAALESMKLPSAATTVIVVLILLTAAITEPGRQLIVLGILGIAPGLAVTELAQIEDRTTRAILVVPVSLAANMLLATIVLYLGGWSPVLVLVAVAAVTVVAFAVAHRTRAAVAALVLVGLLPAFVILSGGQ